MQTHPIELTRQELRDICEAVQHLVRSDYEHYGRVATEGRLEDEDETLANIRVLIANHRLLHSKLSDIEFEWWREELRDDHIRVDVEDAERFDREPEVN